MATRILSIPRIFITRMRTEDIPDVMEIDRVCFATPWSDSSYRSELANSNASYFVAWLAGRIVGYGGLWVIADEVHITTIGVAEDCRGARIGERLLVCMLDESRDRGATRVSLEVRKSNAVAQGLYLKYGFKEIAIRKGYYCDNSEDAVVMWVSDIWDPDYCSLLKGRKQKLQELEQG